MAVVISDRLLESSDRLLDGEPDDHLVTLVQTGHEGAFAAIVRRYERELQAQAHRLTSDGRGEDAVQQAFLNAFTALQGGSEVRHLRGWLHQILRHEVTRGRTPIDAPLEAAVACGETLEDTVARRATAHAALAELRALPDRQRDALLGTAVLGFPRAHVARTMGLSEGAVRQLVHRARLRLRQAAGAFIPFPLVKLFGAARSGVEVNPDAALGAGTAVTAAASGGLGIKVGALLASGVLAGGLAVTHAFPSHHHSTASGAHHRLAPTHASPHASAAPGAAGHTPVSDRLAGSGLAPAGTRAGGPAGRSGARSDRDHGRGPGRGSGRTGGDGHRGSASGSGDGGSGRSPGGSSRRGDGGGSGSGAGSTASSGSGSGSRSGSGSGDDGHGSGSGGGSGSGSGSGSGGGHQSGSGSASGSATGSGDSTSDGGSVRSSGGGTTTTSTDDAGTTSSSGSSGSTPSATPSGGGSSSDGGSNSGSGSGTSSVAVLGSDGSQAAGSGSGSDGGQGKSSGSRDLSGAIDSSSS